MRRKIYTNIVPILTGLLPITAIVLSYFVSASYGHVQWCVPLWDGCTTISAIGRQVPESMIFKGTMNVAAVFIMLYWYLCYAWLKSSDEKHRRSFAIMLFLGLGSAIFLIVYVTALGHIGDNYRVQRRIGVTLFFAFGFFAQIIQLLTQWRIRSVWRSKKSSIILFIQTGLIANLFIIGIANLVFHYMLEWEKWIDNIIEWNFTLLSSLFYFLTFVIWRATKFHLYIDIKNNS